MLFLFCSFRSSATETGKFRFLTFTAKLIMLRIIWPTLTTLLILVCTY
ncbi:hypothetical protein LINGRAHAP2_LOCUS5960 [Linum grandiflorum]